MSNRSSMLLSDQEVRVLLEHTARSLASEDCKVPHCANCRAHSAVWWSLFRDLLPYEALALQSHLIEWGIPLPKHPTLDLYW